MIDSTARFPGPDPGSGDEDGISIPGRADRTGPGMERAGRNRSALPVLLAASLLCAYSITMLSVDTPPPHTSRAVGMLEYLTIPATVSGDSNRGAPVRDPPLRSAAGRIDSHARRLVRKALLRGLHPGALAGASFPTPREILALMADESDARTFSEFSESTTEAAAAFYAYLVSERELLRPHAGAFFELFAACHAQIEALDKTATPVHGAHRITLPGESGPPRIRDLDRSHTYALDIFFTEYERDPGTGEESGPAILAAAPGIVVAASSDWTGGPGMDTYRAGGISPLAGNGVIVYEPGTKRVYSYFHLREASVAPGMVVRTGTLLGYGGNTGSNARKPKRGGHLHLEIFDSGSGRYLRNDEILALLYP